MGPLQGKPAVCERGSEKFGGQLTGRGTNRTIARASIAAAASIRSCSKITTEVQYLSWEQSPKIGFDVGLRTALSTVAHLELRDADSADQAPEAIADSAFAF